MSLSEQDIRRIVREEMKSLMKSLMESLAEASQPTPYESDVFDTKVFGVVRMLTDFQAEQLPHAWDCVTRSKDWYIDQPECDCGIGAQK